MLELEDPRAESPRFEGPELGVIEEARRRQRTRRSSIAAAVALGSLVVGVLSAVFAGGGAREAPRGGVPHGPNAVGVSRRADVGPRGPARLVPALEAGAYGWAMVWAGGGGTCCSLPVKGAPLEEGILLEPTRGRERATFLAGPELSAIAAGRRRFRVTVVQNLPFALRVVQVTVPRVTPSLSAIDAHGRVLPSPAPGGSRVPARWWQRPQAPPSGPCGLHAVGVAGLSAQWGHIAAAIVPYPAPISAGRAFFSCIDTEYYLHGWPLVAAILLDAARPGSPPAVIPGVSAVRGAPGFVNGPGDFHGDITATRLANAWLVVAGGSGLAQRLELLRHLTPTLSLPRT
jgi:hypothetical protein